MKIDYGKAMLVLGMCGIALATSCRKSEVGHIALEEEKKSLSPMEAYEGEFRRLVAGSGMSLSDTRSAVSDLCVKIDNMEDKELVVRLFDRLGELALEQRVSETNYTSRSVCYLQLSHIATEAFYYAQEYRQESFEDWDRLFRFFKKYANEIVAVADEMNEPMSDDLYSDRNYYIHCLKGELKQEIDFMRRFGYPKLINGLTGEQKEDILRRFREIEAYADSVSPPRRKPLRKTKSPKEDGVKR